jgi:hypothetical protein
VSVPQSWNWLYGLSLSAEFGFFRPSDTSAFNWQGELRPIIDRSIGPLYLALNPNLDLSFQNTKAVIGVTPQFKLVYTLKKKYGVGFEYYANVGTTSDIYLFSQQEHLAGPVFDLYTDPDWEVNTGFLFGLTPGSNQAIVKLLLGKRFGRTRAARQ